MIYIREKIIVLSINRFERKKNIKLAIEAMISLRDLMTKDFNRIRLVIAGIVVHLNYASYS